MRQGPGSVERIDENLQKRDGTGVLSQETCGPPGEYVENLKGSSTGEEGEKVHETKETVPMGRRKPADRQHETDHEGVYKPEKGLCCGENDGVCPAETADSTVAGTGCLMVEGAGTKRAPARPHERSILLLFIVRMVPWPSRTAA